MEDFKLYGDVWEEFRVILDWVNENIHPIKIETYRNGSIWYY